MKRYLTLFAFILSFLAQGQTLYLDPTFGTNGKLVTNNDIRPTAGYFENDKYYLFGNDTRFARYNFDGSPDTSFGTYGFSIFSIPGEYPVLKNFKMHNGQCYGFGKCGTPNTTTNDGIIMRLTTDGQPDTTFGTNGMIRFDLGNDEFFSDILINDDGSFYALGTKQLTNDDSPDASVLLCKFLNNGALDTTFNTTGFKVFSYSQKARGVAIFLFENNILLASRTPGTNSNSDILLQKIDSNGNLISSFGTNGNLRIPIPVYGSASAASIQSLKLMGNKIYCHFYWGTSFQGQGYRFMIFDISNPTANPTEISTFSNQDSYFFPLSSGKVLFARGVSCIMPSCYSTKYTLKQFNADGTPDLTFDNDGVYEYDFSDYNGTTEGATFFYKHADERIFIAGTYGLLSMLRVGTTELNTEDFNAKNQFTVYPNPSSKTLYIHTKNNTVFENVFITDISGKRMEASINNENGIDISALGKGIYFLSFTLEGNSQTVKFIKS